jgi:Na+/melibiose symporter-like transporter
MIITAKPRISFLWQFTAALTWTTILLQYFLIGAVFIFSLKKFVDNPAGVTFIMSLPAIISLTVNPFCSYMSDRVWTRWGRRKPFIVTSWIGTLSSIALFPLAPNLYSLIGLYLLFNLFNDIGSNPTEALKQEIVPPRQRGTATALGKWMTNIAQLLFALMAVGRFDDYQFYAGFPINGEQSLYWGVAASLFMMLLLVMLGIKESETPSKVRGERFSFGRFFGAILNNNLWPVYILITGYAIGKAGLGALGALLYTEQWGFTKQEMGINIAVGGVINIFLIMVLGYFADRLPRLKTYMILIFLSIVMEGVYFIYVEFILFDATPTLIEIIFFGELTAVIGILMGMIYFPLVYDYIPRNELGTYAAGAVIVDKIVHISTLNGVGVFVTLWSAFFLPPGGEKTTIVTREQLHEEQVHAFLLESSPPDSSKEVAELSVEAWYATNAQLDEGHAFEIRFPNEDSIAIDEQRQALESDRQRLLAQRGNLEFDLLKAQQAGDSGRERDLVSALGAVNGQLADLEQKINTLESTLQTRADEFKRTVLDSLDPLLLKDGEQLLHTKSLPVSIVRFPLAYRPDKQDMRRTLDALRVRRPELIDARIVNEGLDFFVELSVPRVGQLSEQEISRLQEDLEDVGRPRLKDALPDELSPLSTRDAMALQLDLMIVEDPVNRHISPVTQAVYWVMGFFTDTPPPERRMWASARAMRDHDVSRHIGVAESPSADRNAIRVTAVYQEDADLKRTVDSLTPGMSAALATSFGGDQGLVRKAADLYQRTVDAVAANNITIAQPVLRTQFALPKYDYMSGYLWMISMSIVGFIITIFFARREARGLIHKRGREESDEEAKAEAENEARLRAGGEDKTRWYTPGYIPQKIGIVIMGFVFMGLGFVQLGPDLRLILSGEAAQAVATRVAKERIGGEQEWFDLDAEVLQAEEKYDRSYVFWNEYAFEPVNGERVYFTAPSGKQLSPVQYILDGDGLPNVVRIWYDPTNPEEVVLPFFWSTRFLPGLLILFGAIGIGLGSTLLYYSRKPIAMPLLPPEAVKD